MAYNTRRKQGGRRGNPVTPARGNHHLQQRPIIKQGISEPLVQPNSCMLNAHRNALALTVAGVLPNPSVRIVVGSMGFRSDDGSKTHWEYGGAGWNKAHQFSKGGGVAWDAHAWVVYTTPQGQEVIIDPHFSIYADYAKRWKIKTTSVRGSRVYQELGGSEGDRLFKGMVATTKLNARDGAAMTACEREWAEVDSDE